MNKEYSFIRGDKSLKKRETFTTKLLLRNLNLTLEAIKDETKTVSLNRPGIVPESLVFSTLIL